MSSYKDLLLGYITDSAPLLNWVRDETSNYPDFSYEFANGIKVRVVSNRPEGTYVQVFRSLTNYRVYKEDEYPLVRNIYNAVVEKLREQEDNKFFESTYKELLKLCNG